MRLHSPPNSRIKHSPQYSKSHRYFTQISLIKALYTFREIIHFANNELIISSKYLSDRLHRAYFIFTSWEDLQQVWRRIEGERSC